MKQDSFKHMSVNAIGEIYGMAVRLEQQARSDIHAELALDVRDLCQDIVHRVDMFERANAIKLMPKTEGE